MRADSKNKQLKLAKQEELTNTALDLSQLPPEAREAVERQLARRAEAKRIKKAAKAAAKIRGPHRPAWPTEGVLPRRTLDGAPTGVPESQQAVVRVDFPNGPDGYTDLTEGKPVKAKMPRARAKYYTRDEDGNLHGVGR